MRPGDYTERDRVTQSGRIVTEFAGNVSSGRGRGK